jgi:hypothetical protein
MTYGKKTNEVPQYRSLTMPYSFSSVAYVWVRGERTTGVIAKKFGFSYSNLCFAGIKSFVM